MASPEQPPLPLLFLIGDTGGGHRSAAAAVAQALEHLLPGRFVPVICDPLRGPDVPRLLRWFSGLYGPCIRLTPWLWWLFWRASDSPRVLGAVRRTVMAPVYGSVARAAEACRPALIVAFHPMTADPAVRAGRVTSPATRRVARDHRHHRPDHGAPVLAGRGRRPGRSCRPRRSPTGARRTGWPADRYVPLGLPVAAEFCEPPLGEAERKELKRELGVDGDFLVVLTGGAEGSRRAAPPRRRDPPAGGRRRRRRHLRPQQGAQAPGDRPRAAHRAPLGLRPAHAVGRALRRARRAARPGSAG